LLGFDQQAIPALFDQAPCVGEEQPIGRAAFDAPAVRRLDYAEDCL
jgi:hypothetical protein